MFRGFRSRLHLLGGRSRGRPARTPSDWRNAQPERIARKSVLVSSSGSTRRVTRERGQANETRLERTKSAWRGSTRILSPCKRPQGAFTAKTNGAKVPARRPPAGDQAGLRTIPASDEHCRASWSASPAGNRKKCGMFGVLACVSSSLRINPRHDTPIKPYSTARSFQKTSNKPGRLF
jgi:hypothetical protein